MKIISKNLNGTIVNVMAIFFFLEIIKSTIDEKFTNKIKQNIQLRLRSI